MNLPQLLADYGYWAVFIGALLEGETVLLLAGFAAHQGYLSLPVVMALGFAGGTLGDQFFFALGHTAGRRLLLRLPHARTRVRRVQRLLRRYDAGLIVGIRFLYGLRIVGPVVIGACRVPVWRFVVFNMLGAALWAPLVAGAGYVFGKAVQAVLGRMAHYEVLALVLLAGVLGALAVWHGWRERRRERQAGG
ncbi:MAG: DedA family protein [Betaproteobacteria bacterium]|nr:DedA family protein [Betaproteobacteria bacterium]